MDDKRTRQLIYVILGIIVIIGVFSLLQTLLQMIIPLAVLGIGGFAFYKIVLEGRDKSEAMEDEVAETSNMIVQSTAEPVIQEEAEEIDEDVIDTSLEKAEKQAQERLSAVEKAQRDYLESATPAEEILDQIKARKQRLQGDDE